MSRLNELRQALSRATGELDGLIGDKTAFEAKLAEVTELEGQIARTQQAQQRNAALGRPAGAGSGEGTQPAVNHDAALAAAESFLEAGGGQRSFGSLVRTARKNMGFQYDGNQHFATLGDQLKAIARASLAANAGQVDMDSRLMRAPTGAGEVDATGGGFLVQSDFAQAIFMLSHSMGDILSRVGKTPISSTSNGLKVKAIDETSRATGSRWGGVQSFWVGEGQTPQSTRPKFREVEFSLKKLMSVAYVTDELLQDSTALTSIFSTAFAEEIMFMTEDSIWEGTGVGQPLGIIKSPARVTVAKETGQAAGTIVLANIQKMWSQCWIRSRKNAVWTINQEIEPQLFQLNQPVSTAGGQVVFMPPGGVSDAPYATLFGRPIIPTEYNAALGTEGDIALVDFSQYQLVDKGGINAQTSMHVAFLTDEMVFRITYRVDGRPMWYAPLTPFKGSTAKSPFVTLQSR